LRKYGGKTSITERAASTVTAEKAIVRPAVFIVVKTASGIDAPAFSSSR
jgi:hypothetical protein